MRARQAAPSWYASLGTSPPSCNREHAKVPGQELERLQLAAHLYLRQLGPRNFLTRALGVSPHDDVGYCRSLAARSPRQVDRDRPIRMHLDEVENVRKCQLCEFAYDAVGRNPRASRSRLHRLSNGSADLSIAQQPRGLHFGGLRGVPRSDRGLLTVEVGEIFLDSRTI